MYQLEPTWDQIQKDGRSAIQKIGGLQRIATDKGYRNMVMDPILPL
jgi:hypothetical protein